VSGFIALCGVICLSKAVSYIYLEARFQVNMAVLRLLCGFTLMIARQVETS
jgi:hypothetical protein